MLSHAMAHSPGRLTKKTTLHSTATSASRDPTQTSQFSRFLLASGMTGGVYQTLGGAILAGRSRMGNPGVEPQLTTTGLDVHKQTIAACLIREDADGSTRK